MNLTRLMLASLLAVGCASHADSKQSKPVDSRSTPTNSGNAPASSPATQTAAPFAKEIAAFEAADRSANPPPKHAVVFYGSSSIRFWKSLPTDFPELQTVNRGFGGSTMDQCVMYLDRAVVGLQPKTLVVYAGDNDLAAGHSVERVVEDTKELVRDVHAKLPQTKIYYLAIKPSPSRAHLLDKVKTANTQIQSMAANEDFTFVDVATPMLGADGQPRPELFREDRLHMKPEGYAIWTSVLKPILK